MLVYYLQKADDSAPNFAKSNSRCNVKSTRSDRSSLQRSRLGTCPMPSLSCRDAKGAVKEPRESACGPGLIRRVWQLVVENARAVGIMWTISPSSGRRMYLPPFTHPVRATVAARNYMYTNPLQGRQCFNSTLVQRRRPSLRPRCPAFPCCRLLRHRTSPNGSPLVTL